MKIEKGYRRLTVKSVYEDVKPHLDAKCSLAMERYLDFMDFCFSERLDLVTNISVGGKNPFDKFLNKNEWAKKWIVDHGYALEVEDFKPFSLKIKNRKEAQVLQNRLNLPVSIVKTWYKEHQGYLVGDINSDDEIIITLWKRFTKNFYEEEDGK